MFTILFQRLTMRGRVFLLACLALLALPQLSFAVAMTDVVEMFKYSYGADKMLFLASVETVLFNLLKRKKKTVGGRGQWIIPYQITNAGVFGGISEGATLTTRRAQPRTGEAMFSLVEFASVFDITWKMLRQASRSADAFATAMDFMDNSIKRRTFRQINAQVCSFTGLGELGILPDADDATTITVNSLPFVDPGMYVDLIDASDNQTALVSGRLASDVLPQSREVIISGGAPAGTAASDFFVASDQITGGVTYSLYGLGAWISDVNPPAVVAPTGLGGINRSTTGNSFYKGNVLSNGGVLRAFTEDLLIDGENLMRQRGGVQPDLYVANDNILKRYHGDLIKDRFFTMGQIQGLGPEKVGLGRQGMDLENDPEGVGNTPYTLSGKPFHCEPFFRANRILGFNRDHFFIGHDGNEMPALVSELFDGMVPDFQWTGSAKFDVWSYWEAQLLSDNPQAGIQFQDIAES